MLLCEALAALLLLSPSPRSLGAMYKSHSFSKWEPKAHSAGSSQPWGISNVSCSVAVNVTTAAGLLYLDLLNQTSYNELAKIMNTPMPRWAPPGHRSHCAN